MTENEIKGNLKLMELETDSNVRKETLKNAIDLLKEIQQYQALGTVEELRVAKEKQIPEKPIINYINTSEDATEIEYTCSVCGTNFVELTPCKEWCPYCGNKIDWSDENE